MGVRRNGKALRALAFAACALAAVAVSGAASGHHGTADDFQAATTVVAPTIDGTVGAAEWADTPAHFVLFGELSGTARFKRQGGDLYGSLTVTDPGLDSHLATFYFDDDHDGQQDPGEAAVVVRPEGGADDFYYSAAGTLGAGLYRDVDSGGTDPPSSGGTDDVQSAATDASGVVSFEFRHPLCSADTVHDFCVDPGSTLGLQLEYVTGPDNFFSPGAGAVDASDWGDLLISAATDRPDRLRDARATASTRSTG